MCLSIYLYEDLVQVPLPVRIRSHPTDPVSSYLSSKHRTKSIPPKPNCFVADLNASFVQKIFHVTEWERKTNVQHHSQADDLRARFKVPEWGVFCHTARLRNRPPRLKLVLSDSISWPNTFGANLLKSGTRLFAWVQSIIWTDLDHLRLNPNHCQCLSLVCAGPAEGLRLGFFLIQSPW